MFYGIPTWLLITLLLIFSATSSLFFDEVIQINGIPQRAFVPFVTFFYFVILMKLFNGSTSVQWLKRGTINTMIIYGVHSFWGQITGKCLSAVGVNLPVLSEYFMTFILISLLSIGAAVMMKKYLKPLYIIFGGNR